MKNRFETLRAREVPEALDRRIMAAAAQRAGAIRVPAYAGPLLPEYRRRGCGASGRRNGFPAARSEPRNSGRADQVGEERADGLERLVGSRTGVVQLEL